MRHFYRTLMRDPQVKEVSFPRRAGPNFKLPAFRFNDQEKEMHLVNQDVVIILMEYKSDIKDLWILRIYYYFEVGKISYINLQKKMNLWIKWYSI